MASAALVSIDWGGFVDRVTNPNPPDYVGFSLEGAKSYLEGWARSYFGPVVAGELSSEYFARTAAAQAAEASRIREAIRDFVPRNAVDEAAKRAAEVVASTHESNAARGMELARNTATRAITQAEAAAHIMEGAKALGAVAGLLDSRPCKIIRAQR